MVGDCLVVGKREGLVSIGSLSLDLRLVMKTIATVPMTAKNVAQKVGRMEAQTGL